jgi:hypothetical protein
MILGDVIEAPVVKGIGCTTGNGSNERAKNKYTTFHGDHSFGYLQKGSSFFF